MDLEDFKALAVIFMTGIVEHVLHNPIGSLTAVIGLLYVYQKWQTQVLERKKAEKELNEK